MAGSLNHIVADDGSFRPGGIENMRDAIEALEECHQVIAWLLDGTDAEFILDIACQDLRYVVPAAVPKLRDKSPPEPRQDAQE
jgi:hypothetical protein